ncbi:R3H domain-containing nucleic acid-binding protein [Geotalea sp. SG265]|uniref:R3H domain-containing nucleic acid-binding protein n=1 Tax=Geotalea sp. SG265 TaxID=2922867 RepID=UPI001FAFC7CB
MATKKGGNGSRDVDDIQLLIMTLPADFQAHLREQPLEQLIEVVMDLGRIPQARFPEKVVALGERPVAHEDIAHVVALTGEFTGENRAGIERTLHRISGIRNRKGQIIGLTLRVGRAVLGTIELLRDLLNDSQNILLLGPPGVGKTTKLREMARVLADELHKRVIVIDTSNEIGGDGDIPHPGIGGARRMQVPRPERQHAVMIEAVENHMPEVIIVDEIGTQEEAAAARTIAERGVQLVGTAHGNTLENLIVNPTLSDLIGGVQTVTLSDEEARHRGTMKTITERKSPPTFDIVVELVDRDEVVIHRNTAVAVDSLLRGRGTRGERRERWTNGQVHVAEIPAPEALLPPAPARPREGPARLYPYALSRDLLERVIRDLRLEARTVGSPEQADLVIALRSRSDDMRLKKILDAGEASLQLIKRNSASDMRRLLQNYFNIIQGVDEEEVQETVRETEQAIEKVLAEGVPVALSPRRPVLRKMQHRLAIRSNLIAQSTGSEPERHLVIHPP